MNVIGSRPDGWWKDRRRAMAMLVQQLERWSAVADQRVTVVFEKPLEPPLTSSVVEITAAPRAAVNSADDEIVRLVRSAARPGEIQVVTSDLRLSERVRAAGAFVQPAAGFRDLIESADDRGRANPRQPPEDGIV